MSTHPLDWAPCGLCGALVPRATGCVHWRPVKALARAVKARATRERISSQRTNPGPWSRRRRAAEGKAAATELRQSLGIEERP